MKRIQDMSSRLFAVADGNSFTQVRYVPGVKDPLQVGDLSLGYSNGQLRVYWTTYVGQKGVIDLRVEDVIRTIRQSIATHSLLHPDVATLIQNIANQFMPGFQGVLPVLGANVFLRPHIEGKEETFFAIIFEKKNINIKKKKKGTQMGFALIFYKSWSSVELLYNTLGFPNPEVFKNASTKYPFVSFVSRSIHEDINIGCIRCSLFISQHVNGGVYSEFSIRFLFNSPFSASLTHITQHLRKDDTTRKEMDHLDSSDVKDETDSGNGNGNSESNNASRDKTTGQNSTHSSHSQTQREKTETNTPLKEYASKVVIAKQSVAVHSDPMQLKKWDLKWKMIPLSLVGIAMSVGGFYKLPNRTNVLSRI
ncbi:hypothetical protein RFI_14854 [Reticulomyxa filosa]|uniref:Uncharacterized protein n=1 Tax=Reticulomyxa filosa TaxID=46433 RepID=X6N8I0_RETFI|nr:hypothetical protein RFI_14854 [Reticulomyxa filosa]|eukprot:ETO22346.1 hypothetical protein RFI_14854 [Reticulomyxa filosa]